MRSQIETLFAGWRAPVAFEPIATHFVDNAPELQRFETPDQANAVVLARLNTSLNEADADYPALAVAGYTFGGNPLASRLGDRVRQKEGLSYSIGSAVSADSSAVGRDDAGSLSIQAIAAPHNMQKVETAIREELARLVRDGVTAAEPRDAVSGLLTQRKQGRAADGSIAGMLAHNLYVGRTTAYQSQFEARLSALTVEEVDAALRRHIEPAKLSVYMAGNFAKAGTASAH